MLVRIEKNKYLNSDFIIALMLTEKAFSDLEGAAVVGPWKIIARMLDSSTQLLMSGQKEEMEVEYLRIINDANKRIKKIKYEDD